MSLRVTLTTPQRLLLDRAEAGSVVAPAYDGEIGILPRHAPLVALLGTGEMRVAPGGGGGGDRAAVRRFAVDGGFLEVRADEVIVLAERSLGADEVGPEALEAARAAAGAGAAPSPGPDSPNGDRARARRWLGTIERLLRR